MDYLPLHLLEVDRRAEDRRIFQKYGRQAPDARLPFSLVQLHAMLKLQGKDRGWECVYFAPLTRSCSNYEHRPLECRALFCGDTAGVLQAMDEPALSREHVGAKDSGLWACIEDHERTFPVAEAMRLARMAAEGEAGISSDLDEMIRREMHYRHALGARAQARDRDLWAYLGRPLWLVLLPLNPLMSRYEVM